MKKRIIVSFCALFVVTMLSCNTDASNESSELPLTEGVSTENKVENNVETEGKEKIVETTAENAIESKSNYEKDWEMFKQAVFDRDTVTITNIEGSKEIYAEVILHNLSTEIELGVLKNTLYSDLKPVEEDGKQLLRFSSKVKGKRFPESNNNTYKPGNENFTSILIYFSQGDTSLNLESYTVIDDELVED